MVPLVVTKVFLVLNVDGEYGALGISSLEGELQYLVVQEEKVILQII